MSVQYAIKHAESLLPGVPVDQGEDPRWQAIMGVAEYIQTDQYEVWLFVERWGGHHQEDLRTAIACCILEHLLEYNFDEYIEKVKEKVVKDKYFSDTFTRCWRLGNADTELNSLIFEEIRAIAIENAAKI